MKDLTTMKQGKATTVQNHSGKCLTDTTEYEEQKNKMQPLWAQFLQCHTVAFSEMLQSNRG